ncbi:hypothetical protein J3E68DRAFT_444094 [Trichoderma sp. SZMC 28012]
MATQHFVCANWSADNTGCKKFGKYTCKGCHLVVYCGSDCQKSHWALHKLDCKSPLGKETWRPRWALENRDPIFIANKNSWAQTFSGNKCLWGNVPAIDVLQLESNEGVDYAKHLNLLFAASGDLRNVVKTIAQVPTSYTKPIEITINDNDLDVVARNAIILLIALVADGIDDAVDCIIHVWYSALIRKSDLETLQNIPPFIKSVCDRFKDEDPDELIRQTWSLGKRSLTLVMPKSSWDRLLAYIKIPEGLTAERASRVRKAVTLDESRKDYLDKHLLFQSPSRRVAKHRFRQDGLLLPFGAPRHEFQIPNPTIFRAADVWPMADDADPLQGWSLKDVEDTSSGPATADIYGKLFYHIRAELRAFLDRLSDMQVSFRLLCVDFKDQLGYFLERDSFSRIEVSNMSDNCFTGIHYTVVLMAPFLQAPLTNPHATLITLFRNAVREKTDMQDFLLNLFASDRKSKFIYEYLSLKEKPDSSRRWLGDPYMIKGTYAHSNAANYDKVFDRFMKVYWPSDLARLCNVATKEEHTVIEKWPFRMKLPYEHPGAMEEFDRLVDEVVWAKERFVEWRRTAATVY